MLLVHRVHPSAALHSNSIAIRSDLGPSQQHGHSDDRQHTNQLAQSGKLGWDPCVGKRTGGEQDSEEVVDKAPAKVEGDPMNELSAHVHSSEDTGEVGTHEDDIGGRLGNVGSSVVHMHADGGLG